MSPATPATATALPAGLPAPAETDALAVAIGALPVEFALLFDAALGTGLKGEARADAVAEAPGETGPAAESAPGIDVGVLLASLQMNPAPPATTAAAGDTLAPAVAAAPAAAPRATAPEARIAAAVPAELPVAPAVQAAPAAAAQRAEARPGPIAAPAPALVAAPDTALLPAVVPAQAQVPAPGLTPAVLQVAAPVQSPAFPEEFAARVTIAVRAGVESASITVTPPDLGPVELRVSVQNQEARVHFAADSAVAREALVDALPRLRELLAAQGLALAESSVGAELPRRDPPSTAAGGDARPAAADAREAAGADAPAAARPVDLRLVDVFA